MTDGDGASHACRILRQDETGGQHSTTVTIRRGETLVATGAAPMPNFIKVDVEGHELAAISGMAALLARPECRGVLVEVHFALLAQTGQTHAPGDIKRHLRKAGFRRLSWVSRSHLLALKV